MPKEVNLTGDQVVALTRKYLAAEDVAFVQKALVYAVDCHSGQFRKSGEPYIVHPIQGFWPSLSLTQSQLPVVFCMMW